MVRHPPALDSGTIADEDALSNGQGAVIPHEQEVEDFIGHPVMKDKSTRHSTQKKNYGQVELKLLILILVSKLGLIAEEGHAHVAKNQIQVEPGRKDL